MRRILCLFVVALVAVATPVWSVAPKSADAQSPPRVMAAAGDSITRAFDVDWCCVLRDDPARSWSTGSSTLVDSHYQRLLVFDPKLAGHANNDAVSGARMRDLASQLAAAAAQRADYVTIEMGANDLCTSSIAAMTPTSILEEQFRTALRNFVTARPRAQLLVASIPDIYWLWQLFHTNVVAQVEWTAFGICQSMLSLSNTEAMRQEVVAREIADNATLAQVCTEFAQCRWDGGAVYNIKFSTSDVSPVDYFHPSTHGQDHLAAITWAVGYWPSS